MFEESGWVNKVVTAGIIAMIGWTLLTVQDLAVEVAVLKNNVGNLTTTIATSQSAQYSRSEARADLIVLDQRIERLEEWAERLSDRMKAVENVVAAGN